MKATMKFGFIFLLFVAALYLSCSGSSGGLTELKKGGEYEVITDMSGIPAKSNGEIDKRKLKKLGHYFLMQGDKVEYTGNSLTLKLSDEKLFLFELTKLEERESEWERENAPEKGDQFYLWPSTVELFLEED